MFTRVSTVPGAQQMCIDHEGMNKSSQEDGHACLFGGVGVGRESHPTSTLSFGFLNRSPECSRPNSVHFREQQTLNSYPTVHSWRPLGEAAFDDLSLS